MGKRPSVLGMWIAIGLSLAGIVGFVLLFIPQMDMYWFILAPLIFAVYQFPAAVVYTLWKKRRAAKLRGPEEIPSPPDGNEAEPPADPR